MLKRDPGTNTSWTSPVFDSSGKGYEIASTFAEDTDHS
jgi:hypothetical protein